MPKSKGTETFDANASVTVLPAQTHKLRVSANFNSLLIAGMTFKEQKAVVLGAMARQLADEMLDKGLFEESRRTADPGSMDGWQNTIVQMDVYVVMPGRR